VAEAGSGAAEGAARRLAVGLVGAGAMGRNHLRILAELPGVRLAGVYDLRREAAEEATAERAGARVFASLEELAAAAEAVVLAVPTADHAEVGCRLLAAGKHLLVEKPLAATLAEADRLLAAAADRVLAVGHVEFFNPAVAALLGLGIRPGYVEVERLGSFSPRSLDVDVVLDLMIHDLQILHALDPTPVTDVRAKGINVLSSRVDIANARVELASGCVANLTASRVSAERVRKLRLFLPRRYFSVDYVAQEVKGYRLEEGPAGRAIVPADLAVAKEEPLRRELAAFAAACRGRAGEVVDGAAGRRALETALAVVAAVG
jgi:predicted dehydrogenase